MNDFEDRSTEIEAPETIKSKTPSSSKTPTGNKLTVFFQNTVGPSQRQGKMVVNENAPIGDIKYLAYLQTNFICLMQDKPWTQMILLKIMGWILVIPFY